MTEPARDSGTAAGDETGSTATPSGSDARRRRWPWLLLAAVVVVLFALRLALPPLATRAIEDQLGAALGRPVHVDDVAFALWRGRVTLAGVSVGAPGAERVAAPADGGLATIPRLHADLHLRGLLSGGIELQRVEIEGARLRLRLREGLIEPIAAPQDTGPEPGAGAEAPDAAAEDAGWALRVRRFDLRDFALVLEDASREQPPLELALARLGLRELGVADGSVTLDVVELEQPRLAVLRTLRLGAADAADAEEPHVADAGDADRAPAPGPGFRIDRIAVRDGRVELLGDPTPFRVDLTARARDVRSEPDARFPIEAELALAGGTLELSGELGLAPLALTTRVEWAALDLAQGLALLGDVPSLELRQGQTDGALDVTLGAEQLELAGRLELRAVDLRARTPGQEIELATSLRSEIRSIRVPLAAGVEAPARVELVSVAIAEPRLRLVLSEAAAATEAAAPAADAGPGVSLGIDSLTLDEGRVVLRDRRVGSEAELVLSQVALDGRALRWPSPSGEQLGFEARAPGGGRLAATARGSLADGRVEIDVERVALPPLSPWSRNASGWSIAAGALSFDGELRAQDGPIATNGQIVLHGLEVSGGDAEAFARRFGVSLNLALALLRDLEGDIRLPLDLRLADEGARVALAPLLTETLRTALAGALTTPVRGLSGAVRQVGDTLGFAVQPLGFAPGSDALADEARAELDLIARALAERPALALRLRPGSGAADVEPATGAQPTDEAADAAHARLAAARLEAVRRYLAESHDVAPERVVAAEPHRDGPFARASLVAAPRPADARRDQSGDAAR